MAMFKISYYKNGKLVELEFNSLIEANKAASIIFDKTGIVVGIERK